MKRYNNLFEKIVSIDNLYLADKKARKNKSNRNDIKEFDKYKDSLLVRLQSTLINQTYTTSKYDTFIIREPKERLIFKLPYYPDRIVHHAIMNILEPIWRSVFITNTYSCIKKRGIHKALYDIQSALKDKQNTVYCLKLDVRKFYPSIDHEILKQIVRKKIKDKMCKKVAAMNKLKHMTYSEYRQQVCSHIGWMKHCNGINLLKKIIKYHQLIEYARSS